MTSLNNSNNNNDAPDLPIALRRGKRRSSVLYSPVKPRASADIHTLQIQATSATPARRSKRVRFSDSVLPSDSNPISTGITPHLRRASLGTPRQRRAETPSHSRFCDTIQFTPFKQVLDDRVKRRIRRNGLSEEMNEYEAEKKTKVVLQKEIEDKDAELKRLKAELEEARNKPEEVTETCVGVPSASQERLDEVEAELEALRQSFALDDTQPEITWAHVQTGNAGPSSDGGDTIRIYEDDDDVEPTSRATIDADSLAMGLELEAARQAKQSFLGSFRESSSLAQIEFADSPARRSSKVIAPSPQTPRSFYHDISKQLKATINRAEEVETAFKTLENEVIDLGFGDAPTSGTEAAAAIANHFRQARLELERALPGETAIGFENALVLPEVIFKLKTLSSLLQNKEYELKAARDQHHNLKGNFEKAIVAAEKATARIRDLETSIDTNAEDMLNIRIRAQRLEGDLAEKEKDVESLTSALHKYRADVSRLELLIGQLESDHAVVLSSKDQAISDLDAKVAAEQHGRRAAETSAMSRLSKITELETALTQARTHATTVEMTIAKIESQLSTSISGVSHNEEVGALNTRISNLSTALASVNAEVEKLKITKAKLEERVRMEVEQGARAVEAIQADLIKSVAKTNENKKHYIRGAKVRIANWELSDDVDMASDGISMPMTPASMVRFAEFSEEISLGSGSDRDIADIDHDDHIPGTVELTRGKRKSSTFSAQGLGLMKMKPRRRYDSGIGMSPVSETDHTARYSNEPLTPELSSELDIAEVDALEQ